MHLFKLFFFGLFMSFDTMALCKSVLNGEVTIGVSVSK